MLCGDFCHADIYLLRRFLRARQHNIERAKEMFLAHLEWRKKNDVDTILTDFVFQERDAFISLYPQGYHQTDKQVCYVLRQLQSSLTVDACQLLPDLFLCYSIPCGLSLEEYTSFICFWQ
jgi:hypothetical protein